MIERFKEQLDQGEREAIALAIEMQADYLLIDEKAGREIARQNQLTIVGTIGILLEGRKIGRIENVRDKLDELRGIGFWISDSLYDRIVEIEKRW